ncbi:MAG: DotU family type IV/VI secretion system protein [Betaproteobacteria bacterium]|nr:DotU family type IV/VI secretion system protein [Betaproteobacteria bacterium]
MDKIPALESVAAVPTQTAEPDADSTLPPLTPLAPPPAPTEATSTPAASAEKRRKNPFAPKALPEAIQSNLGTLGGLNPLIAAANPILCAVPHIRHALRHPDPEDLRDSLQDLVEAFEASASSAGSSKETIDAAICALCTLVDESATSTPWGGDWGKSGLLQKMRGDKRGEEGFFAILDRISATHDANADLLEFFYVCLALGYEGRYRELGGGKAALEQVRSNLHAIVARLRGLPVDGLSETWQGVGAPAAVPAPKPRIFFGVAAGAVLALAILYLAYDFSRETASGRPTNESAEPKPPVVAGPAPAVTPIVTPPPALPSAPAPIEAPKVPNPADSAPKVPATVEAAKAPATAPVPAARLVLAQQLAEEIRRGEVALTEEGGRATIIIRVVGQFASGGTQPQAAVRPIIEKIGTVLESAPGAIVVTAHTDSMPIKSALFPSNLELSAARAKSVAQLISAKLSDRERIKSVGAGDSAPIAPNDTAENRAKNRRVVIDLRSTS